MFAPEPESDTVSPSHIVWSIPALTSGNENIVKSSEIILSNPSTLTRVSLKNPDAEYEIPFHK